VRIAPRLIAPLTACGIAVGACVAGGACFWLPKPKDPPTLKTGIYVLTPIAGQSLPAIYTDSIGRKLRVVADTIILAPNQFYDEHTAVAITPPGGNEGPVGPVTVSHQPYFVPFPGAVTFIVTLFGGSTRATVVSETSFQMEIPSLTVWRYEKR
jgi:hypothetical protein